VQENKVFGLPQINIRYDRDKMALYGIKVEQVNRAVQMAFGGAVAGVVYEDDKRFDLTFRLTGEERVRPENIENLMISDQNNNPIPLREVAAIEEDIGPSEIGHENLVRRVNLGFNVRGRDLIFGLLYLTFGNFKDSFLIYATVPLSAVGGVFSLLLRDMNFSISAGVGFIALFGVAVLNGILLVSHFNELARQGLRNADERVLLGLHERIRPVLMTSFVAAFGFLPMALSTSVGAEVQKPLATVVIGGLLTATLLTLVVLPVLYSLFDKKQPTGLQPEPVHISKEEYLQGLEEEATGSSPQNKQA